MIIGIRGAHTRNDDHIVSAGKLMLMQTIDLTQSAADPVADNSVAHLVRYGEADSIVRITGLSAIEHKTRCCGAGSFGIETPKLVILF